MTSLLKKKSLWWVLAWGGVIIAGIAIMLTVRSPEFDLYQKKSVGLKIISSEGEVLINTGDGKWKSADENKNLSAGFTLKTGKDGKASVLSARGDIFRLSGDAEVKVVQAERGGISLYQSAGRTYHSIKSAGDGGYRLSVMGHILRLKQATVEASADAAQKRINVKLLEGSAEILVGGSPGAAQPIPKYKEITVEAGETKLSDIGSDYETSEWFLWNQQEDRKAGYETQLDENPAPAVTDAAPAEKPAYANRPQIRSSLRNSCSPVLSVKKMPDGVLLNWTACASDEFRFYKVIRSTVNASPSFPEDRVILSSSDKNFTSAVDQNLAPRQTYYYRICVIELGDGVNCGKVAKIDN